MIFLNFPIPNPYLSPIAHPTAFIRKQVPEDNTIIYDENCLVAQDYALWNTSIKYGKISNITDVLLKYRVSDNQISKHKRKMQIDNVYLVTRDHIQFYFDKYGFF